jgi:hypothetical protein
MSPGLSIPAAEVAEFDRAIAFACRLRSAKRVEQDPPAEPDNGAFPVPSCFYDDFECLAISFDTSWFPFLDGRNAHEQEARCWYVPKSSRLLGRVAHELQAPDQRRHSPMAGAHVFLSKSGVTRRPAGKGEIVVLRWILERPSLCLNARYEIPLEGEARPRMAWRDP